MSHKPLTRGFTVVLFKLLVITNHREKNNPKWPCLSLVPREDGQDFWYLSSFAHILSVSLSHDPCGK